MRLVGTRSEQELLQAGKKLWLLSYDAEAGPMGRLAADLAGISSPLEDRLYAAAQCALKPTAFPWLRRQALIYDLVNRERLPACRRPDPEKDLERARDSGSRVDFALAYGNTRLVVEGDGPDHCQDPAQRREDQRRDRLLKAAGWKVRLITNDKIEELEGKAAFDHLLDHLPSDQATQLRDGRCAR